MKKILVTGGAGFLGSHLCDRLVAQGHHVLCVDNYFTGSKSNIQHLLSHPNFEIIRQDVCFPLYVEVDEIYNLACPASPKSYQSDPIQTIKTSVLGAYNLLGLAKRTKARILQASTSEIYGDPLVHPQHESYWGNVNPVGPRACYDEGKRAAETLFMDYYRQHNVDIRIARIFNTYGPRMGVDDGRVVSNFIVQALQGQHLSIYGTGNQTRSFCYVDDLVDGILALMSSSVVGPQPVNLGNPTETTVRSLAEQILHLTNSSSIMESLPLPVDDPQQRRANITRAVQTLGWEPKVPLTQGLQKTISYFQQALINQKGHL
jgi:UDP-glucuronate decarboxylase